MTRRIEFSIVYPHPIERVWQALTDPAALAAWLMENDFKPIVGHEFTLRSVPVGNWNGTVQCRVLEIEPPFRLVYSWVGTIETVVTYTLETVADGTRMTVLHEGFDGDDGLVAFEILSQGWWQKSGTQIPQVLERLAAGSLVTNSETPA